IGAAGTVAFDAQPQLAAQAPAMRAIPGRARQELVLLEEEGEARLGHLHAAEFQAAGAVPLAGGGPAIALRAAATSRPCMEHVPDEGLFRPPCVAAGDRHAEAPAPAAHGAVRAAMLHGADDRLHDLIAAMAGAHGHRRALPRPDHGALLRDHLQRAEGAVILG